MINFCTLFDSHYSAKGLAMYESLVKHCPSFHLYIFAFDEKLVRVLEKMNLSHVTVVTLEEFEDDELLSVKSTRTPGEYCWTCSGSTILYCLQHFNLGSCTYLDADLYFFADPSALIDEMGNDDVLITEHRYSPEYDQAETSGKYCVQFMTFKNSPNGLNVLKWWRNACLEWCYARVEDGKFGDQKYLDDWTSRFDGIHELQHLGGGVAPWNMQQYVFSYKDGSIVGKEIQTNKSFPVVFFHFHGFCCYKKWIFREFMVTSTYYELSNSAKRILYSSYMLVVNKCYKKLKAVDESIDGLAMKPLMDRWNIVFKRFIKSLITNNGHYAYWLDL